MRTFPLAGTALLAVLLLAKAGALLVVFLLVPLRRALVWVLLMAVLDGAAAYLLYRRRLRLLRTLVQLDLASLTDPGARPGPRCLLPVYDHLRELLLDRREQDVAHRQIYFLTLQEQINPHFLYNALESVRGKALCVGEYEISDMTEALGNYFRYLISNRSPIVTIESEIENIETYFRIQRFRFGDRYRLEIDYETDPYEIQQCILPKLTLQPLVENAIMHGLEMMQTGGVVTISMTATERRLILVIRDNGCGIPPEKLDRLNAGLSQAAVSPRSPDELGTLHQIGIKNVSQRIRLVFGKLYGIRLTSIEQAGTDVILTIPKLTQADLHGDFPLCGGPKETNHAP